MGRGRTAAGVMALGVMAVVSVTGRGQNGGGPGTGDGNGNGPAASAADGSAPGPSASRDAAGRDGAGAAGLRRERDEVDAALDAAAARARLTGLSPDPDPDAASPAGRRLGAARSCGRSLAGRALVDASADGPFATAVRALEEQGWKAGSRRQSGRITEVVLTKGRWTVRGRVAGSGRTDQVSFAGYHESCAQEVAALPVPGGRA
ncbi:hypothetical protein ACIOG8_30890 [Streptomyces erythrochromogenes]|uniref:hypothetical protein n=1 Tax=Streptomyces erythrochromogenes TaxID=285574 RepID=UPI00382B33D8